jgi:hypothetical protein
MTDTAGDYPKREAQADGVSQQAVSREEVIAWLKGANWDGKVMPIIQATLDLLQGERSEHISCHDPKQLEGGADAK